MSTVSVTRLRVRSVWFLPLFGLHALRSTRQAMRADGVIHVDTHAEDRFTYWTKTVWQDTASMKRFRSGGAHQVAMRVLSRMCSEASYTRWEQATADVPDWHDAHKAMLETGILSSVKNPSVFHRAGHTAPPLGEVF